MTDNLLLRPWTGPLGGVPPLDQVEVSMFEPALVTAMAHKRAEIEQLRSNPEPPTFANTLEALERAGATLDRVAALYGVWASSFATPELRAVRQRVEPQLSELHDAIFQDPQLYHRVEEVAGEPGLSAEQTRLIKRYLETFRRAGAQLDPAGRERIAQINQRLSILYTTFSDNLLADEESHVTFLSEDQLGGLSASWIAGAAAAAEALGATGSWAVTNTRSSVEPFLASSTERTLRERVWRAYFTRGDHGDEHDNKPLIVEVLALRLERARLLGFESHAQLQLQSTMAATPERATELMQRVWGAASAKFRAEVAAMQALADARGDEITIEPWDVRYYAALIRRSEHDLDPAELQQHYQLEQLREGMFWTATQRFGWTFELEDLPVPHPDVRAWRVRNADGSDRGLFYLDPFARRGKRSGAWMMPYRVQDRLDTPTLPIVSNNCNFLKPPPGQPTLLTPDQVRTLFHEFGHAIHGLASDVTYPTLSGTRVPRDYVEFPSQLNEHWMDTPELLSRFALHQQTGAPPSPELLERSRAATNADSGFRTMEYLASAVVDMALHQCTDPVEPAAFETQTLAAWGLPPEVVMRHRTPQFAHIFSGDSYSAGYYSYLWADVLTADAAEAFAETGFYDRAISARLMETVLSRGNTIDPAEGFRAFLGRDTEVEALLRDRGLI
ncbi:MAG TPA: M3 family peptidase [Deltaproteobacteria bacterium]|nr:M3 family peptidase [Deltaproteobacteria bacterium]